MTWRLSLRFAAMLIGAACLPGERLAAQHTYWRIPAAFSGAMAGAGAGWAIDIARWQSSSNSSSGPSLVATPAGIIVGGLIGFAAGHGADRTLARGDTLSSGKRGALRLATFLTPVAVGSAIAFAIINPSEGGGCVPYQGPDPNIICTPRPKPISDEGVLILTVGGGVVLGYLAQHKWKHALWPRARVGLAPSARGVAVSLPLGW